MLSTIADIFIIIQIIIYSLFVVIVWWIIIFGGKFSLELNNPITQIKKLLNRSDRE